jgi:hypothetical protein
MSVGIPASSRRPSKFAFFGFALVLVLSPHIGSAQAPKKASAIGVADGERMMRRFGEPDRLGFVYGRLGKSSELGKAHDQEEADPH